MTGLLASQVLLWRALQGDTLAADAIDTCFAGSATLPAAARLAIYANMYGARLTEALRDDFPATAKALGTAAFADLCAAYVRRHPSTQASLAYVGQHLAAFLRAHPGAARVDLADLAALEWARASVFTAADATCAAATSLGTMAADALPTVTFTLVPALARVPVAHDITALWRALDAFEDVEDTEDDSRRAALPTPCAEPTTLAVWRADFCVYHTALRPADAAALALAQQGAPFAAICDAFALLPAPIDAAFAAIGGWFADGWIHAVRAPHGA